jgi:hypothetical protein
MHSCLLSGRFLASGIDVNLWKWTGYAVLHYATYPSVSTPLTYSLHFGHEVLTEV